MHPGRVAGSIVVDADASVKADPGQGTIPRAERNRLLSDIVPHLTDNALVTGTVWGLLPQPISHRMRNARVSSALGTLMTSEAHLWDLE